MIKRKRGIESQKSLYGYLFLVPWSIGLLMFFIKPMFDSIRYSFSEVTLGESGMSLEFKGLENFKYIINSDPSYLGNLKESIIYFAFSLPVIIAISMILGVMLNQKFSGRIFMRAIYFLPVIIASSVVMDFLNGGTNSAVSQITESGSSYTMNSVDFEAILLQLNFPNEITEMFSYYIQQIFDLIWSCGVPIVLFIAGLQSIPDQLYEASRVEGANKWEEFWYITFPMLGDVILLVIVYVSLDLFTAEKNLVIEQAYSAMRSSAEYDLAASMLWVYFLLVVAVLGIVLGLFWYLCLRRWRNEGGNVNVRNR